MTITPAVIGKRMVIRHALSEKGPSGGQSLTDVIGRILSVDERAVRIERRDGSIVSVELESIVLSKIVPPTPIRSRQAERISADNLMRVCSHGWPAIESVPLGEWELRASQGFTCRANSVAVLGDPGVSTTDALRRVRDFYAERELPALAQVIVGSDEEKLFTEAGWHASSLGDRAVVQVTNLSEAHALHDVQFSPTANPEWFDLYLRAEQPETARVVLEGPPTVAFATIGDPVTAIARVVVTGEWAGLSCFEVAPKSRRQGNARRLLEACIRWARDHGADKAYLQVTPDNQFAISLYEQYGFRTHHEYRYLTSDTAHSLPLQA